MHSIGISLIVPCTKRSTRVQELKELFISLKQQRYQPSEVLLLYAQEVSGAIESLQSFLQSAAMISYATPVRFHELAHGAEANTARNNGVEIASGEILSFCEPTDLFLPDYFNALAAVFEQNPECQLVLTSSFYHHQYKNQSKTGVSAIPEHTNDYSFAELSAFFSLEGFPFPLPGAASCRSSIFSAKPQIRFDERFQLQSSFFSAFGYRLLNAAIHPYIISRPLLIHRIFYDLQSEHIPLILSNRLAAYDHLSREAMIPLLKRIAPEIGEKLNPIKSQHEKLRERLLLESYLLSRRYRKACAQTMQHKWLRSTFYPFLFIHLIKYSLFSRIFLRRKFKKVKNNPDAQQVSTPFISSFQQQLSRSKDF